MTRLFKVEFYFILLVVILTLRESFVFFSYGTTVFNAAILLFLLPIFASSRINSDFYAVFSLVLFLLISVFININYLHLGGFNTFILLLTSLPFFFLKPLSVNSKQLSKNLMVFSLVFLFVVYFYYLTGSQVILERISFILAGPYVNQNTLSMILLSLIALLLNFYNRNTVSRFKKTTFHMIIFILYLSIVLTQARAAMLSAGVLLLFYYRNKIFFVLPLLLILSFTVMYFNPDISSRLLLKLTSSSSSGRVGFWVEVITAMLGDIKAFLFGYGVNNTMMEYQGGTLSVHNSYVNFLANYGFIAFSFLIMLLLYTLYKSYQASSLVFVSVISLLFYGLFETVLFSGYSVVWVTLLFIYYTRSEVKNAHINYPVRTLCN